MNIVEIIFLEDGRIRTNSRPMTKEDIKKIEYLDFNGNIIPIVIKKKGGEENARKS